MTRARPLFVAVLAFASPAFAQHEGHAMPEASPTQQPEVDHAAMGHVPADVDHAAMGHATPEVDHAAMGHAPIDPALPRDPIPTITPEDRAAAFPDLAGHAVHDTAVHSFVLLDRFERRDAEGGHLLAWEASAWIGNDIDRLWLRSDGEAPDMDVESATLEVLYGRAIATWWDAVAGLRHDVGDGPSRTFAALGVMGVAPGKLEVEATAYLGQSGRTAAEVEVEYDTLLTNRLILQWTAGAEFHGQDDVERGIGAGLSAVEAGLRLRYEFTRRFAPYIGVAWERAHGDTAAFRRADGHDTEAASFVVGARTWF